MHLKGVFGVCGVKNNNQRIYTMENYGKMVGAMQSELRNGAILGELEHPNSMNINLENASHKIVSIDIDEKGVVSGEIALLNTPKGKIAQAIIEGGAPLFISSRAQGNVDRNGMVTLERLQTYDLVGSPGFSQAKLHLNENQVAESICESCYFITEKESKTNENNTEMNNEELKKVQEQLAALENKVKDLEELNEQLKGQLNEKQDFDLQKFSEGIQKWVVEQYSPQIQKWVVEQYSPQIEHWVINQFAPEVQKWVIEQYSPEVQNWVINEYTPGVQKWLLEDYSTEVQKWLCEQYAASLQGWITEHYEAELMGKVNGCIAEGLKNNKTMKLEMVDALLNDMEKNVREGVKPTFGRTATPVNENLNPGNGAEEPKFIKMMPEATRVKWNLASDEVKESIVRRARLYNLNEDASIEGFWAKMDGEFDNIKGVKSIYEGLENVQDERERMIRAQLRAHRRF